MNKFSFATTHGQNMFTQSRAFGAATQAVIHAIQTSMKALKVSWTPAEKSKAEKNFFELRDMFKAGLVAGRLAYEGDDLSACQAALLVINKKPYKADAEKSDDRRSLSEHKAVRSADARWSQICRDAGKPATKKGKNTNKGAQSSANAGDGEPRGNHVLSPIPEVKDQSEAYSFALRMRDLMEAFIAKNAKQKLDDVGTLFREYIENVAKLHNPDKK